MTDKYVLGQLVLVTATYKNTASGSVVDPDVVKLDVTDPNGTVTTYTYGSGGFIVKDSTGVYHANIDAGTTGFWYYRWYSTGNGQAADVGRFEVDGAVPVAPLPSSTVPYNYVGQTTITTLGTITTGAWQGSVIAGAYLDLSSIAYTAFPNGGLSLGGHAFRISTTYPGQTSLVTVGTIVNGTWNATPIAGAYLVAATQSLPGSMSAADKTKLDGLSAGTTYTADETTLHLTGSAFSIKSTYVGQSSITTLGTITTGIWHGTPIVGAYLGTDIAESQITGLVADLAAKAGKNDVTLFRHGNVQSPFNAASDTEAARGAAVVAALATAQDLDTIFITLQNYDVGNNALDLSLGGTGTVGLLGMDKYNSRIKSSFAGTTPVVHPGLTNGVVANLTIESNATSGSTAFLLGSRGTGNPTFNGARLQSLRLISDANGFYVQNNSACTATLIDVESNCNSFPVSIAGGSTSHVFEYYSCIFNAVGPSAANPGTSAAVNLVRGTNRFYSTKFLCTNGGDTESSSIIVAGGTADLFSGRCVSTNTGLATALHIHVTSGTCNVGPGLIYDSTKTSGTITKLNWFGVVPTTVGMSLVVAADAAAVRTAAGLGTSATHASTDYALVANNLSDVTASTARTNLGAAASATTVTCTAPITGTGTLGANLTIAIVAATGSVPGSMSAADKTKLDASTSSNTASTIVLRGASGEIATGVITTNQVTGLSTPSGGTDAANKAYVDATANGLQVKATAALATTGALPTNAYSNGSSGVGATLTGISLAALTVDGQGVTVGQIILVKNEVASANNGLYIVTAAGSGAAVYVLTRYTDMNTASEFSGAFVPVGNLGTANANSLWLCNPSGTVTVGTTAIPFTQLNGATDLIAGTGINITGNTVSNTGVTSVGLSLPSFITVSNSPVTTTGTLTGTLATQTANFGFLGPISGSAAAPTFRALVPADIPVAFMLGGIVKGTGVKCIQGYLSASINGTSLITDAATGSTYTPPSGKRALCLGWTIFNNSGASPTSSFTIKSGGSHYQITANLVTNTTTTSVNSAATLGIILEAGENLGFVSNQAGVCAMVEIVEYDSIIPLSTTKQLGLTSGNATLYTVPANTSAFVLDQNSLANSLTTRLFICSFGAGTTVAANLVKSGGSVGATNQLTIPAGMSVSALKAQIPLPACLGAGDFVNVNVATTDSVGISWLNKLEWAAGS